MIIWNLHSYILESRQLFYRCEKPSNISLNVTEKQKILRRRKILLKLWGNFHFNKVESIDYILNVLKQKKDNVKKKDIIKTLGTLIGWKKCC